MDTKPKRPGVSRPGDGHMKSGKHGDRIGCLTPDGPLPESGFGNGKAMSPGHMPETRRQMGGAAIYHKYSLLIA